ncbi:MAG: carbohydrate ABC transporter permease [Clostridiales bacterium]|nr:carbohydrate ABC transporter permease [Clostridiales bacterium]
MKRNKNNAIKSGNTAILTFFLVVFLLYAFTLVFPFVWIFYNSFKNKLDFWDNPMGLPARWSPGNYINVFKVLSADNFNLSNMFFNSFTLLVGQVAAALFVCVCAAYVVSKYKFPGRTAVYFIAILIMFIPTTGSLVVYYTLMQDLRFYDNYLGMIVSHASGFGFGFLILYGFFKSISWSYAEAAFIDGAGSFTVFFRIMLPMAKSVLVALAVLNSIGVWNDYMGQMLFYPSHPTVAVGLQNLSQSIVKYESEYPLFFCAILICTIPVIALYASCQKIIVKNTMAGGLKG